MQCRPLTCSSYATRGPASASQCRPLTCSSYATRGPASAVQSRPVTCSSCATRGAPVHSHTLGSSVLMVIKPGSSDARHKSEQWDGFGSLCRPCRTGGLMVMPTLRASLSGTFLQTLPDLVTPLKGHSLSPRSCPATRSAPSERFGY